VSHSSSCMNSSFFMMPLNDNPEPELLLFVPLPILEWPRRLFAVLLTAWPYDFDAVPREVTSRRQGKTRIAKARIAGAQASRTER
jgi:hypothetical protein